MSQLGQTRPWGDVGSMSGLPPKADLLYKAFASRNPNCIVRIMLVSVSAASFSWQARDPSSHEGIEPIIFAAWN